MGESNSLASLFLSKLNEQIELTLHLIDLVPRDKLEWRPQPATFRVGDLLGHLLECLAGFCAILYKLNPDRLSHFAQLRQLPVNHCCTVEEAAARIRDYQSHIRTGFEILSDSELTKTIQTVFEPEGQAVFTLLLGNLEHLINHKYQLFFYLKLLGTEPGTSDLYRLG